MAITPGRILYLLYHRPLAAVQQSVRAGGPINQWIDLQGQRAMRTAAATLPPRPHPSPSSLDVCFLTGKKFWYQTAFCASSLAAVANREFSHVFLDDGTFDNDFRRASLRLFPSATLSSCTETEQRLDEYLPTSRFPSLRAQRLTYLHLRKLTDAHAGRTGWRLVLDSDMLFFRRPAALLDWLAAPDRPIHMLDVHDAYGYPAETMRSLATRPLPPRVNVGICGLRSDTIDWEKLEWWTTRLLALHGTSYYLEQALVALLLADASPLVLPAEDYRLMPDLTECLAPTAALHHYVDLSKRGYFRHAWRHHWRG